MHKHIAIQLKLSEHKTVDSIRKYLYREGNFPLGYMMPNVAGKDKTPPLILILDVSGVTGVSVADLFLGLRYSDSDAWTPFSGIQIMNYSKARAPKVRGRTNLLQGLQTLSALLEEPFIVWDKGIGIGKPNVIVDVLVPNALELMNIVTIINSLDRSNYSIKEAEFNIGLTAVSPTSYIDQAQVDALRDSLEFLVRTGTHAFIGRTYVHKTLMYYIPSSFTWLDQMMLTCEVEDEDDFENDGDQD